MSFFGGREEPKMFILSIQFNIGSVFTTSLVKRSTFQSYGGVLPECRITLILGGGRLSEIIPTVIRSVPVFMVYMFPRPVPSHEDPDYSMD